MANILTMMQKQAEKGKVYLDLCGNFLGEETVTDRLLYQYTNAIKNGSVKSTVSFENFKKDHSGFVAVDRVIAEMVTGKFPGFDLKEAEPKKPDKVEENNES